MDNLDDIKAESITIGDKLLVTATYKDESLIEIFSSSPQERALDFAQQVQTQLFAQAIATIRTSVNGVQVSANTYSYAVELQVIDIVNPSTGQSTLGQTPEFQTRADGVQVFVAGTINIREVTGLVWALAALAVGIAANLNQIDNFQARRERDEHPDLATLAPPTATSNIRDALIAAGVISVFYFLSKVSS